MRLVFGLIGFLSILVSTSAPPAPFAVSVPLTIQEAIYPGSTTGVARTDEPVTVGLPLPDDSSTGVTGISSLGISGASVGQFRVLGTWPSGRAKWVLVDTLASLSAGGTNTSYTLTNSGSGNFGGSDLATDNGSTITVATGSATFTIKKANFNGLDTVVVGSTTIVTTGHTGGLVVTGPAPSNTSCGTCTTEYKSVNDASSTASIEENGPVRTVIKATGDHKDGSGNVYMHFTVRFHFVKGKSTVKAVVSLRNADLGATSSFASAFKGFDSYELRVPLTLSGTTTYTFGTHSGTSSSTLSTTDDAYIYQAKSTSLEWATPPVDYTSDTGYDVRKNGASQTTGTSAQYSAGWGNVETSGGVGLLVGHYQAAAYYPKSIEFNDTGTDTRIGIWPSQNSSAYYQAWPQYSTHDVLLSFHTSALASNSNEFLKFQHKLLARAALDHYNTADVFPLQFTDSATEDAWYTATQAAAVPSLTAGQGCCAVDLGTTLSLYPLSIYRYYSWGDGGGFNQFERRWSRMMQWLIRGMPGRFLDAAHFYRMQEDFTFARSDGFDWRDQAGAYNAIGFPTAVSTNCGMGSFDSTCTSGGGLSYRNWIDLNHHHWYGWGDYYFLTGDEGAKDALLDGPKDQYLAAGTYFVTGQIASTRGVGVTLLATSWYATFLNALGDSDESGISDTGQTVYEEQVKPELCVSDTPTADATCAPGFVATNFGTWTDQKIRDGTSRYRGVQQPDSMPGSGYCSASGSQRIMSSFQAAILLNGLLDYATYRGTSWADYWEARDLAYGTARFVESDLYKTVGNSRRDEDGYRYGLCLDLANATEPSWASEFGAQTLGMVWYMRWLYEGAMPSEDRMRIQVQRNLADQSGPAAPDYAGAQWNAVINRIENPGSTTLQDVPLEGFVNNGGGSYTLKWIVPSGSVSYRLKYAAKRIVDWIGFDPSDNTWDGDPTTTIPWFGSTNATAPSPSTDGTLQSTTITGTGSSTLTAANFSVKAVAPAQGAPSEITWALMPVTSPYPAWMGYTRLRYDPGTQATYWYGAVNASTSIYGTDMLKYVAGTNTWSVHPDSNGSLTNDCNGGGVEQTSPAWPRDRHAEQQAIDTSRGVLWVWAGVCAGSFDGVDTNQPDRIWKLTLNSTLGSSTWSKSTPSTLPTVRTSGAMVYSPDDDVLFLYGDGNSTNDNYVYCPSSGSLSAAQTAAGCTGANDWAVVTVTGGTQPPQAIFQDMWYEPVTKKVILYGGSTNNPYTAYNEIWAYDIPTKTWTNKSPASPPPVFNGSSEYPVPPMAYLGGGYFIYRQLANTGNPRDWIYSAVDNTWTVMTSNTGPVPVPSTSSAGLLMAYDASAAKVIGVLYDTTSTNPRIWQGTITGWTSGGGGGEEPSTTGGRIRLRIRGLLQAVFPAWLIE